jgi:8-oxo-dGTP diphosphatase
MDAPQPDTRYRIASLVFLENRMGEQLLLKRAQSPNKGMWSPIGGKLHTTEGESPLQCALRETFEETGVHLAPHELHLFGYLAEANYEGSGHWLVFLFHCLRKLDHLPPAHDEGPFGFHALTDIPHLAIPPGDLEILWPVYQRNRRGFTGIRIQRAPHNTTYTITVETEIQLGF